MTPFTFVHAADLHLGSPFKGVSIRLPHLNDALHQATTTAFNTLVSLCIDKDAAFLLVAGDVFDDADRSLGAQLVFRDGVAKLDANGIHTFVVHGNHDPESAWAARISWPRRVHFFGSDAVSTVLLPAKDRPVAAISGISYSRQNEQRRLVSLFEATHPDLFQIGLLHTRCGHHPDHAAYAPCTLSELSGIGMDYWALGHVHEKAILSIDPHVVYPGNSQGLSILETGPRGCFVVSVDDARRAQIFFHPLDALRWFSVAVDSTGMDSPDELEQAICLRLGSLGDEADGRPVIARVTITGRTPLYATLRKEEAVETLLDRARAAGLLNEPPVWIQALRIDCLPEMDLSLRRRMEDLLGQVLRDADTLREKTRNETTEQGVLPEALTPALGALFHHRRLSRWLDPLTPADRERLFAEAERLCLDFLEPDT